MKPSTTNQHCCCTESHKLKALIFAVLVINLVIACFLISTQLYQRAELSKDIKACHKDVNDLRQMMRKQKMQIKPAPPYGGRTKEETIKKISSHNKPKRSLKTCPFKKEDRCTFLKQLIWTAVLKEVQKEVNKTKLWLRDAIQMTIKEKVIELLNSHSVQAHIAFYDNNNLSVIAKRVGETETFYLIRMSTRNIDCKTNLHFCRRNFEEDGFRKDDGSMYSNLVINYDDSKIKVLKHGFYWLSVQLTIDGVNNTLIDKIAKVSILMTTKWKRENVILMSQVPKPFTTSRPDNVKQKLKLYSVTMGRQVKLLKGSMIRVVLTLKPNSKVNVEKPKEITLYGEDKMNGLDIFKLPRMTEDDGQDN